MTKAAREIALVAVAAAVLAAFAAPLAAAEAESVGPASPAAAPRNDDWIIIGPGGGGGQFYPTVSPHDTDVACVRCDMTGSFITRDGGRSWRMFNLRGATDFFCFDPVDPDTIYCKNVGLYRSTNGGETWHLVHPNPEDVEGLVIAGDHGEVSIAVTRELLEPAGELPTRIRAEAWGSEEEVKAMAIDPADSRIIYAAIGRRDADALFISRDRGEHWKKLADLPSEGMRIFIDAESPADDRAVHVVCSNLVCLWNAGELTVYGAPAGVFRFTDTAGGFDPETGRLIVYGITWARRSGDEMTGGLYVSTDGGRTWNQANEGLMARAAPGAGAPRLRAVGACLGDGRIAYLSYSGLQTDPGRNEKYFGVAKTTDAGKTWNLVWKECDEIGENMIPGWISLRFGPGWGENPISIGVAPTDPDIVYGTDLGRTMLSTDGAKTWKPVYTVRWKDGAWTTTGLDVTTCYGVHFDPFDKDRLFISYTDIGAFVSDNYGVTWQSATTEGVPRRWVNTTYWMLFDRAVEGRVWAVMSGVHDLPRPKMWRRRGRVRPSGGVCVSDDGGRTWRRASEEMPETACTHIIMDPESPPESRTLYVTGFGTGVWKSTDGGATWSLKNEGIEGAEPFAWRLARDKNGLLYLVVARKSEDGTYGTPEDGALYRSSDGAETWQKLSLPEGLNGPNGIAVDPDDPRRLYLAAWGRYRPEGAVMGGIWLSEDAGETWTNVLAADQYVYDVTIDPNDPNVLYACGFSSSAWRSADRGATWKRLGGFNFKWGHRVIPDPRNPGKIFITTFGASVWYGPATGDPDAVEDIVTPVVSYDIENMERQVR